MASPNNSRAYRFQRKWNKGKRMILILKFPAGKVNARSRKLVSITLIVTLNNRHKCISGLQRMYRYVENLYRNYIQELI